MKKVIIIEGVDNCGKDSLINNLITQFKGSEVIHTCVPSSNNLFKFYYNGIIHHTLDSYYHSDVEAIIHNRSMYGEYVYGPKYRNESKESVFDIIKKLELGQLRTFILDSELYFILLTSSDSDLIANNDDGLSISSNKSDIEEELAAFNEVFDKSSIKNKKKIFVNNGPYFRSKEDIYKEALHFITIEQGD